MLINRNCHLGCIEVCHCCHNSIDYKPITVHRCSLWSLLYDLDHENWQELHGQLLAKRARIPRAYQQHDPFLSPDIGPVESTRPRDYARPRTEARQAAEQRLLNGLSTQPESIAPSRPQGGLRRPAAVY